MPRLIAVAAGGNDVRLAVRATLASRRQMFGCALELARLLTAQGTAKGECLAVTQPHRVHAIEAEPVLDFVSLIAK